MARRLAVAANCDPRTIIRVLTGQSAARHTMAAARARQVLEKEGLLGRGRRKEVVGG